MCFASPVGPVEIGSPCGTDNDYLLNNSHTDGCPHHVTTSCNTPDAPVSCNYKPYERYHDELSCESWQGTWTLPLLGDYRADRSTADAVLDSSMGSQHDGPADSVCVLEDIVKTSLSLHSSLSVSTAGQAGSWFGSEAEFMPCLGNSSLGPPAINGSMCIPAVSCLPMSRHSNNKLQPCNTADTFSPWPPLAQQNALQSGSNCSATDAPAALEVPQNSMAPACPPTCQTILNAADFQAQAPDDSSDAQEKLCYSDMGLQLQNWLEGMEPHPAMGSLQHGGIAYGLPIVSDGPAAPAACRPVHTAPAAGLPVPAFVLLGML